MVSIMLLAGLVPLMSTQASAVSAPSDNGQSNDFTWMYGVNGTTFLGYNGSSLQLIDIHDGTVYQSVSCTSLPTSSYWKGGPIKISADEQYFMCASERYRLVGLNLVSVSSGAYEYTMDVKSGFNSQWVRPDSCWNKHDGDGTLSIMNGTSYIANVTAVRDGANGVVIESMHLYEDNPYKMLVIFAANDGSDNCDDSVNRRYLTIDFNSSTQANFGSTRGSELSGCTQRLKVHNLGAIATHYGGSQCTSITWFDLDSANPWNDSAKKGVDSWMDANSAGTKYHWSVSPDCWMAGIITSNSTSDLQHVLLNGTRYNIPSTQYSGKELDAVACTSNENGTMLIDGVWHTYWGDNDDDGVNDLEDAFPNDSTQTEDTDGDGYGDSFSGFQADACVNQPGISFHDRFGCPDMDNDGWSDQSDLFPNLASQWNDTDGDGYGDNSTGWQGDSCAEIYGYSSRDRFGCPDDDLDGWSNEGDAFDSDSSQWNDTDSDGWGDNGVGLNPDGCPLNYGNSTEDRLGCPDWDGDGWSDVGDDLPSESTQWKDSDGDGFGDNQGGVDADAFPLDGTQWMDTDGDGYGDNEGGNNGDSCPSVPGNSTIDRNGCIDRDGDGVSDLNDAFPDDESASSDTDGDGVEDSMDQYPFDPTQWNDTDGDGHGDNPTGNSGDKFPNDPSRWQDTDDDGVTDIDDAFPTDRTQWNDTDRDGFGDEIFGTRGDACSAVQGTSTDDRFGCPDADGDGVSDKNDAFANDPSRWQDSDSDGYEDSEDLFPFDPSQWADKDGDGMGDNPMGVGADKFPNDPTQWGDIDGDGYGDNAAGNNADAFITDPTQWSDADGDGYGDNPAGRLADAFPANPTQWEDLDGDGLGDNQSGTDADPYLDDFDNDGYNDSIDILPKFASPGDLDGDGCLDDDDAFPSDARECSDADGDGVGDNADADDDNDGALDTEEAIAGTNQFSSSSKPIESFEIILPGTSIGLGAWDIIGMFAGIPAFTYLALMISTRSPRVRRFEEDLYEARSEAELADISARYERAMLFRLIGPHHGLRLERIRSKLENRFESTSQGVSGGDMWTAGLDTSSAPDTSGSAPSADQMGQVSSDGYEWLSHGGAQYYRAPHSGQEWTRWG